MRPQRSLTVARFEEHVGARVDFSELMAVRFRRQDAWRINQFISVEDIA
jgi:hypothetical protein